MTDEHAAAELNLAAGDKEEANIQLQAVPSVHVRLTNLPVHEENGFSIFETEKVFGSTIIPLNAPSGVISPNEYEVAGLPPGQVTLVVSQNDSHATYSRTINANLSEGETLNASERGGIASVSGRVTFPAGAPIPMRATVLLAGDNEQNTSGPLQKDGTFSFAPLPGGTYKVSVDPAINEEYVQSISANGAKISDKEITIETAGDVQLNITMGQGFGHVTGVVNLDGKPTSGLMVLPVPASGRNLQDNFRMDQSDSDGTFALPATSPGKYLLLAIEDGWDLDWTDESVFNPYLEKAQSLQISANDQMKLVVEAQQKNSALDKAL